MKLVVAGTWDGRPIDDDERVELDLELDLDGDLLVHVDAPYHGDPLPPVSPGPTPKLWEHEVVELFVAGPDARYVELELGPAGHFLFLRFAGTRQSVGSEPRVEYAASIAAGRWKGRARIPWGWLPQGPRSCNAFAIHGLGAARRYLAMAPSGGARPDFHRLDAFVPFPVGP